MSYQARPTQFLYDQLIVTHSHTTHSLGLQELRGNNFGSFGSKCYSGIIVE